MNYKLNVLSSVFSVLLLSACGGSSSSDSSSTTENPPSPSSTTENVPSSLNPPENVPSTSKDGLNGTWLLNGGCSVSDEKSKYTLFKINSIDAVVSEKIYANTTCNESDLLSNADSTYSLTTGSETKGSDRVSTIELDLTRTELTIYTGEVSVPPKGVTFYSMYRIDTQGRLLIADKSDIRTGATTEERANDFTQSIPFVRQ